MQKDWREKQQVDKARIQNLGQIWDKEKLIMIEYCKSNGGASKAVSPTKKNKQVLTRIKFLSDDLKWSILKKYFAKCNTEFKICFTEHRLDFNPSNFQQSIYAYIEKLKDTLKE